MVLPVKSWDAGLFICVLELFSPGTQGLLFECQDCKVPGRSTFQSNVKLQSAAGHSLVQLTQFEGRKLVIQSVTSPLGGKGSQTE